MQCHCCGQFLSKKFWTKGQWTSSRTYHDGYIGCRSCREAIAYENGFQSQAVASQAKQCLQFQDAEKLATCMDELCYHVALHAEATRLWDIFMEAWQMDVFRETRKDLSHYGALPTTLAWEPRHWTPDDAHSASGAGSWYFDAGNDVYAFTIEMLFPHASSTQHHNSTYLGDVVEAILGLCWKCRETTGLATILTRASKYVYGLKACLVLGSFDQQENRKALCRFIAEHSQFRREEQSAARDSGATTGTSGAYVSAAGRVELERSSSGGAGSTSDAALPIAWFEEFERHYLLGILQNLHLRTDASALPAICDEAYNMPADGLTEHESNIELDGAIEHVLRTTQARPRRKKTKQPDATVRGIATKRMENTKQPDATERGNEAKQHAAKKRGKESSTSNAEKRRRTIQMSNDEGRGKATKKHGARKREREIQVYDAEERGRASKKVRYRKARRSYAYAKLGEVLLSGLCELLDDDEE